jgi:hypothetical protein
VRLFDERGCALLEEAEAVLLRELERAGGVLASAAV